MTEEKSKQEIPVCCVLCCFSKVDSTVTCKNRRLGAETIVADKVGDSWRYRPGFEPCSVCGYFMEK